MRVLAFDPGAERMGYAVIDHIDGEKGGESKHRGHGLLGLNRDSNEGQPYQEYRLNLIALWVDQGARLIKSYEPDVVVNEIVPPVGGSAANQVQRQLATSAITTVQAVAMERGVKVVQIGATTVKKKIGGKGKATKVAVRNGVIKILPDLAGYKGEWTKVFDVPDAYAIGLTYLGHSN